MDILIVEDSTPMRLSMVSIIKDSGHSAVQAKDGETALEILSKQSVDLIFMDVEMPGISGFEATVKIREMLGSLWVPIIFLTGNSNDSSYLKGIEAGGDDYLIKPVSPVILSAKITAIKRIIDMQHELEATNLKLEKLSQIDGLTQLYNHRTFISLSQDQWSLATRNRQPLSLVMLDIDHFKLFNDFYGHPVGDTCLKKIAKALSDCVQRPTDIIARYGGEEFIILLPNTDLAGAEKVGKKIKKAIYDLNIEHKMSTTSERVSASIGISVNLSTTGRRLNDVIKHADVLMYTAKNSGRNKVTTEVHQPSNTVLVSDDDLYILKVLEVQLGSHCRVLTSVNGQECVDIAREEKPDLIIMDIHMPVMDGIEACKVLKADRQTSSIPIILLSSFKAHQDKHAVIKESGANSFIEKPIDNIRLLSKVNHFLI
jgi:diguanylate cyclase (GGDEF)-like protein